MFILFLLLRVLSFELLSGVRPFPYPLSSDDEDRMAHGVVPGIEGISGEANTFLQVKYEVVLLVSRINTKYGDMLLSVFCLSFCFFPNVSMIVSHQLLLSPQHRSPSLDAIRSSGWL